MEPRRQALLDYLVDVARHLVARGVVRQKSGQSLLEVLRSEPQAVLREMGEDLSYVLRELGVGLVRSKFVRDIVSSALEGIADRVARAVAGGSRK